MEKKQVNSLWKPLCLAFAALFALSLVFCGLLCRSEKPGLPVAELPLTEETGGATIGESTGRGISLLSAQLAPQAYEANGVSPLTETAYTLTATVTPSHAMNKEVDWSVAFADPETAWAKGKTVTDYVTVTPESDGALTATVECLQAFAAKIKVTVTSREDPSITAECVCDYAQRCTPLFSASGITIPGYENDYDLAAFNEGLQGLTMRLYPDWTETGKRKISFSNMMVTYTLPDNFTAEYTLKISDRLKGFLTIHAIFGEEEIDITEDFTPNRALFDKMFGADVYEDPAKMNNLITDLDLCEGDFTIECTITGTYSQEHYSIPIDINTASLTEVSALSLNEMQHVF